VSDGQTKQPFFTIGIPFYSHIKHFPFTLASIVDQTFRDFEVVVCDDASPDGEECKALCEQFSLWSPRPIRYIRYDENKKIGINRQRVLQESTEQYVTMVDSDDLLFGAEALQMVAGAIMQQGQQSKTTDLVYSQFVECHNNGHRNVHAPEDCAWVHGKFFRRGWYLDKKLEFPDYPYYEDGAFMHVARHLAGHAIAIPSPTYLWIWTAGSITRSADYLHMVIPWYADSFYRAWKIVKEHKGQDNCLDLILAMICQCYYYSQRLERRYAVDDESLINMRKIIAEAMEASDIINKINADEQKFMFFRQIFADCQKGPMAQDLQAIEPQSINDWLKQHFGKSITAL
jgi:glycosyltransferase involved in cell wall biosynthesis